MPSQEIGNLVAKVSIDQTGFQQGVSKLNRELKVVQSEFQASSAKLGDFGKSADGLKLKAESLTQQIDLQRQKVQLHQTALQNSTEKLEKNSKATADIRAKLEQARSAYAASTQATGANSEATVRLKTQIAELEKAYTAKVQTLESDSKVVDNNKIKLSQAKTQLANMENELKKTTAATQEMATKSTQSFNSIKLSLSSMADESKKLQNHFAGLKTAFVGIIAAIAGGAGLFAFTQAAAEAGDKTYKLATKLNVTAAEAGNLNRILTLTDASVKPFIATITRLDKAIMTAGKNGNDTTRALKAFRVSLTDANGNLLHIPEQLEKLAQGYQRAAEAGWEQEYVTSILGARGQELIPLLQDYAEAAEVASRVKTIGIDPKAAHEQVIEMKALKMEVGNVGLAFSNALIPLTNQLIPAAMTAFTNLAVSIKAHKEGINSVVNTIIDVGKIIVGAIMPPVKALFDFIAQNGETVKVAIVGLGAAFVSLKIATVIDGITKAMEGWGIATEGVITVQNLLKGIVEANKFALMATGIGAVAAACYALYQAWTNNWGGIQDKTQAVINAVQNAWDELKTNIASGVGAIGENLKRLQETFSAVWDKIGTRVIVIGSAITGLLIPKFVLLGAQAVVSSVKVVASWVSMAAGAVASATVQAVQVIPSLLKQFVALTVGAAQAAVRVVASWATMAAQAVANAVRMAAAWVIAMGPVGWVGAAIAGLIALVVSKSEWMAKAIEVMKEKVLKVFTTIANAFDKLTAKLGGKKNTKSGGSNVADFRRIAEQSKEIQTNIKGTALSFGGLGAAASGAAKKAKTAWTDTAEALKNALGTLQTQHETEMIHTEMAGDKVAVLRLKHSQLNEELEKQKQVVAATRTEVDKAIAAGVKEGETKEDLAKRVDELNKKLADEEKAQTTLEKQIYDTDESMKAQGKSAKDLVTELKKVWATYNTDMAAALGDYQKKVKDTNDALRKDTEALQRDLESKLDDIRAKGADRERQVTEQFQKELESRTKSLMNFVGLFDEVTQKAVSGDTLLRNLEGQVAAFDNWQEGIKSLAARGIDEGLLQELREMGPKAGSEIAALNTLTDAQLSQYTALWKQKQEQAKEEATTQLAQQRQEMNQQLSAIRQDTQNQLEQQRMEMAQKLQEMQAKAKEELEKYKLEWEKKNEEIRKNTEKNVQDIHDKFNDLVGKSSGYGISLMENFMSGIDSMMPAMISKLEAMTETIDSYMPHSPAKRGPLKRLGEWGPALVGTFAEGIKRSLPSLENVMARMALLSPGVLQPAVANSHSSASTTYGPSTYHIYIQGANADEVMEKLKREIHKTGERW